MRKQLAALVVVGMVAAVLPVLLAVPATAYHGTPPDGTNDDVRCNVAFEDVTLTLNDDFKVRCYTNVDNPTVTANWIGQRGALWVCNANADADCTVNSSFQGSALTHENSGSHTCTYTSEPSGERTLEADCHFTTTNYNGINLTGATRLWFCEFQQGAAPPTYGPSSLTSTHGGIGNPPQADCGTVQFGNIENLAYPAHWYTGGESAYDEAAMPAWDCGRLIQDAGNGRHFVDVRSFWKNRTAASATVTDPISVVQVHASWEGSTPVQVAYSPGNPIETQLLTPPVSEMPAGGWVVTVEIRHDSKPTATWPPAFPKAEMERHTPSVWIDPPPEPLPVGITLIPKWWREQIDERLEDVDQTIRRLLYPRFKWANNGLDDDMDWTDDTANVEWDAAAPAQLVGGGNWDTVITTCSVLVDPTDPGAGAEGGNDIVDPDDPPPGPGDAGGDNGDGTCNAGFWGDLPIIGGAFDGFARVICGLADILGRLLRLLRELLIPDDLDWSELTDALDTNFPFNVVTGLVEGMTGVIDAVVGSIDAGSNCAVFDLAPMINAAERPGGPQINASSMPLRFPTPAAAGCSEGSEGSEALAEVGDLFGFAGPLRQVMVFGVYVSFAFAIVRAVTRRDPEEVTVDA